MLRRITSVFMLVLFLVSCNAPAASSTPDMDAQIQTAIASTEQAKDSIEASVQQTVVAMQPIPPGTGVPPTPTAFPTVDPSTLTEEELIALIERVVASAYLYADQASTATTTSTSDGTISEEEYYYGYYYYSATEAYIEYAETLINTYMEYYGAYAESAIVTLEAIEQDLNALSQSVEEISNIFAQGAENAQNAIQTLQEKSAAMKEKLTQAKERPSQWKNQAVGNISEREKRFANLAPTDVASDRDGALWQVFDYLDTFKAALKDGKIDPNELKDIAQRAANARASLDKHGGPGAKNMVDGMDRLTRNASRGEWSHARKNMDGFERSMPERPKRRK